MINQEQPKTRNHRPSKLVAALCSIGILATIVVGGKIAYQDFKKGVAIPQSSQRLASLVAVTRDIVELSPFQGSNAYPRYTEINTNTYRTIGPQKDTDNSIDLMHPAISNTDNTRTLGTQTDRTNILPIYNLSAEEVGTQ